MFDLMKYLNHDERNLVYQAMAKEDEWHIWYTGRRISKNKFAIGNRGMTLAEACFKVRDYAKGGIVCRYGHFTEEEAYMVVDENHNITTSLTNGVKMDIPEINWYGIMHPVCLDNEPCFMIQTDAKKDEYSLYHFDNTRDILKREIHNALEDDNYELLYSKVNELKEYNDIATSKEKKIDRKPYLSISKAKEMVVNTSSDFIQTNPPSYCHLKLHDRIVYDEDMYELVKDEDGDFYFEFISSWESDVR